MRTEKEILARITEIKKDERLGYPTATVFENAPLALVQITLTTELHTLERIMDLQPTKVPIKNVKRNKAALA